MVGVLAHSFYEKELGYNPNDCYLSYLPLPHVLERLFVCVMLYFGARVGFYSGDTKLLKEDLAILKPTVFASVPRLYNTFYAAIKKGIDSQRGIKGYLANQGLTSK